MKTLLPSGVCTYPVLATRLNVCVLPETVPGVQTMPIFGAPAGSAPACPGTSTADPAASATTRPSRLILCVIVAPLLGIGLTHCGLWGQWRLVDPNLGLHPAGSGWRAEVGQPAPVPVLE